MLYIANFLYGTSSRFIFVAARRWHAPTRIVHNCKSHALLITCQSLVISVTIVLRSINARRVAHLVGSSYRGVDPTGRVSIVGDELKGRLNQTVTNFFSLLDTGAALTRIIRPSFCCLSAIVVASVDPLPWLELGLSPPLRDADRDVKLFTSVMGYTHRIYGAVMRRQRCRRLASCLGS